ncbi:sensor histidine kinase [Actinoplanes sp. OR16]|uniref:sensor histidine kinase n=1 Tax=Actinoplanes sp. OR16 TaxID=946334 RepID=UPI000FD88EB8|nr:sensor histidine kinase [Actinoplanes sp. OR16]
MSRILAAWRSGEHAVWFDLVLVTVLSAAAMWMTSEGRGDMPALPPELLRPGDVFYPEQTTGRDIAANLLLTLPLLVRRRWPVAAFLFQLAALLAVDLDGNIANLIALLIGVYAVAIHGRSAVLSMGVLFTVCVVTAAAQGETWPSLPDWAGVFVLVMPIGLLGVAVRAARSRAEVSEQRAVAVEREQQAATRLAVAHEQARIARELHDIVSHHVSVMTIQAGAAGKVLARDPQLARTALAAVEASGRETMAELRHLLGVLAPGPDDDLLHPQPGLGQLPSLVESVRQAGHPVELTVSDIDLPRGLDLTAYRVVQEALTNALRYAPGARTMVTVRPLDGDLVVEVINDEPAPGAAITPASSGGGSGLLGLSERLRSYGGSLVSGRRVGGGFRVCATVPLALTASDLAPPTPNADPSAPVLAPPTPDADPSTPVLAPPTPDADPSAPVLSPPTPDADPSASVLASPMPDRVIPTSERVTPASEQAIPAADRVIPVSERSAPGSELAVPGSDLGARSAGPGVPAAGPGVPAAGPGVPAAGPGVPAAGPGVPAAGPGVPAAGPGVPAAGPGAPAAGLGVPAADEGRVA